MDAGSSVTLQVSVGELLACQAPDAEHRTVGERWLRDVVFSGSEQSSLAAYRLGLCLHRRGDVMHAETMFLKALREDPAASSAANALAWLYSEELGQPARAIELLDRFARDGGEVTPDMHDTYAAALIRMGSFAAARHRLLKCLPLAGQSPTISAANYRLGVVMMETGEPDAGRAALRHALELDRELGGLQDRERSHARRLLGQAGTG
jgi:Tfp pilus assembly protein PilF